ncbi:MAG: hypothetical protein V7637_2729 [Mycobacteriales bacterium]
MLHSGPIRAGRAAGDAPDRPTHFRVPLHPDPPRCGAGRHGAGQLVVQVVPLRVKADGLVLVPVTLAWKPKAVDPPGATPAL